MHFPGFLPLEGQPRGHCAGFELLSEGNCEKVTQWVFLLSAGWDGLVEGICRYGFYTLATTEDSLWY